jgi:hypothetical protein
MRRSLFLLAVLFTALPMFASWWPVWSDREVNLLVGETATVYVSAQWSGLVDYGNGVHWTFGSTNPAVAQASVSINSPAAVPMRIVGIASGVAQIVWIGPAGYGTNAYVTVYVRCGAEPPVAAATPLVRAAHGQPATLLAVSEIANRSLFHWYSGRTGDTSHPLESYGSQAVYVPSTYGVQYVWVEAATPCSTSTAEFTIDVPLPKPRAVRR